MNTETLSFPKSSHGKNILFMVGMLIFAFAYMIAKEVSLPYVLMAAIGLIYCAVLFLNGLSLGEITIYILAAYLPFSKKIGEDFGHLGSAFNFINILVVMGLIFLAKENKTFKIFQLERTSLNLPLFIFIGIGAFSIFRYFAYGGSYLTSALISYLQRWFIPILLYFLVLNTVKTKQMAQNLVVLIMIATVVIAAMACLDYMSMGGGDLDDSRISGVTDNPNVLAAFISYYMFLFLGFFLVYFPSFWHWALLIPFLICTRGIMVTFSRAGYLAICAGSAAAVFFRKKIIFPFIILAIWFVWQNPDYLPSGVRYRLGQTILKNKSEQVVVTAAPIENSLEQSARTRVEVWKGALWMIREHPVLGVGYSLFETKIQHYWPGGAIDAHNTYLLIASEMGIPALMVFLWILFEFFKYAYHLYKKSASQFSKGLALGFIGGIFSFLVANMFGSRLDSSEVSSYFWILGALIVRLNMVELGNLKT